MTIPTTTTVHQRTVRRGARVHGRNVSPAHTMSKRIHLIQAQPDANHPHLGHALEASYAKGASDAGHRVRHVALATLDFPLLRSQHEWEEGSIPASLKPAQDDIAWAEHIVFFFPLWLGDMPALLKGFLV